MANVRLPQPGIGRMAARVSVAVTVAVSAGLALGAAPAQAGQMWQEWATNADYRASKDFIPDAGKVWAWGKSCAGGAATLFAVAVVRTSDNHIMLNAGPRQANEKWFKIDDITVSPGTAYYMRWGGFKLDDQGKGVRNQWAPCQGVSASW